MKREDQIKAVDNMIRKWLDKFMTDGRTIYTIPLATTIVDAIGVDEMEIARRLVWFREPDPLAGLDACICEYDKDIGSTIPIPSLSTAFSFPSV